MERQRNRILERSLDKILRFTLWVNLTTEWKIRHSRIRHSKQQQGSFVTSKSTKIYKTVHCSMTSSAKMWYSPSKEERYLTYWRNTSVPTLSTSRIWADMPTSWPNPKKNSNAYIIQHGQNQPNEIADTWTAGGQHRIGHPPNNRPTVWKKQDEG